MGKVTVDVYHREKLRGGDIVFVGDVSAEITEVGRIIKRSDVPTPYDTQWVIRFEEGYGAQTTRSSTHGRMDIRLAQRRKNPELGEEYNVMDFRALNLDGVEKLHFTHPARDEDGNEIDGCQYDQVGSMDLPVLMRVKGKGVKRRSPDGWIRTRTDKYHQKVMCASSLQAWLCKTGSFEGGYENSLNKTSPTERWLTVEAVYFMTRNDISNLEADVNETYKVVQKPSKKRKAPSGDLESRMVRILRQRILGLENTLRQKNLSDVNARDEEGNLPSKTETEVEEARLRRFYVDKLEEYEKQLKDQLEKEYQQKLKESEKDDNTKVSAGSGSSSPTRKFANLRF
jgi:hypothetical protein